MMNHKEQPENRAVCALPDDQRTSGAWWSVLWKIQAALLLIGMALGAIYLAGRIESYFTSRSAIGRFDSTEQAIATEETQAVDFSLDAAEPDFSGWGAGRVRAFADSAKRASGAPLAVLQIPKIDLQAPVFNGIDGLTLNHAVGRIAGTAMPGEAGNVGLAAHRDGFFRRLKDIQPGDKIDLKTHRGIAIYTVDRIQIVSPSDLSVLRDQGKPVLTLVTCYPFYFIGSAPKRFVVTAYRAQDFTAGSTVSQARLNTQPLNPTQEEQ